MDATRELQAASQHLADLVSGVPDDGWDRPTPSSVTVRELLERVVAECTFAVRLLRGASSAEAATRLDHVSLGAVPEETIAAVCAAQTLAFSAVDSGRVLHHPAGDLDVDTFLTLRLGELVVQGWDVAVATAQEVRLEPTVATTLWALARPRWEHLRALGPFGDGPSGTLAPDASLDVRVLDAFGRPPLLPAQRQPAQQESLMRQPAQQESTQQ